MRYHHYLAPTQQVFSLVEAITMNIWVRYYTDILQHDQFIIQLFYKYDYLLIDKLIKKFGSFSFINQIVLNIIDNYIHRTI